MNEIPKTVVVYGAGQLGRFAETALKDIGVTVSLILDASVSGVTDQGTPIVPPHPDSVAGEVVVVAVLNNRFDPRELVHKLHQYGASDVALPPKWFRWLGARGKSDEWYWLTSMPPSQSYKNGILNLDAKLTDEESHQVLKAIVDYRDSGDAAHLSSPRQEDQQYVGGAPDGFWAGAVRLLDLGACTGDVPKLLLRSGIQLDSYTALEPDPANFRKLVLTSRELGCPVTLVNAASGARKDLLKFDARGTSGSSLADFGNELVAVLPVDALALSPRWTHWKLDVEGSELDTLIGGAETLAADRPKLALSVYHRPWDLVDLSQRVEQTLGPCSFAIRTYAHQSFETVLFVTPSST